jgi:hypothetical protein
MLFYSSDKVNKLILLRRELYSMPLRLFKAVLVNLAKRSTGSLVLLLKGFVTFIFVTVIYKGFNINT